MKRFLPLALVLVAVGCSSTGTGVGSIAPEIKAEALSDGRAITLAQFRGKVVVLDFWATWCGPCIEALPHLAETQAKYGDKVVIMPISAEDKGTIQGYLFKQPVALKFIRDPDQSVQESYGVTGYPTTFVIDKEGKIAWASVGFDGDGLDKALAEATK